MQRVNEYHCIVFMCMATRITLAYDELVLSSVRGMLAFRDYSSSYLVLSNLLKTNYKNLDRVGTCNLKESPFLRALQIPVLSFFSISTQTLTHINIYSQHIYTILFQFCVSNKFGNIPEYVAAFTITWLSLTII